METDSGKKQMEKMFLLGGFIIASSILLHAPVGVIFGFIFMIGPVIVNAEETKPPDPVINTTMNIFVGYDADFVKMFVGMNSSEQRSVSELENVINIMRVVFPRSDTEEAEDKRYDIESDEIEFSNIKRKISTIYWDSISDGRLGRLRNKYRSLMLHMNAQELYFTLKELWTRYEYDAFDWIIKNASLDKPEVIKPEKVGDVSAISNFFRCLAAKKCAPHWKWKNSIIGHIVLFAIGIGGLWLLIDPPRSIGKQKARWIAIILEVIFSVCLAWCWL